MTDAMTTRTGRRRGARALAAIAAACMLVVACGSGDDNEEPERRGAFPLLSRSFVLAEVTEAGEPVALAEGSNARLAFDERGALTGNGGCNDFIADVDQEELDNGRLVVRELSIETIACDPDELLAQEGRLTTALTDGISWRMVVTDLVLQDGGRKWRFEDESMLKPDVALEETMWVLDTLVFEDVPQNSPEGATASMQFNADGSVEIHAGCNRGSGSWSLDDDGLVIEGIALTRSLCFDARGDLEELVLRRIDEAPLEVIIKGDRLTLLSDASDGLSFVADAGAEPDAGPGGSEG